MKINMSIPLEEAVRRVLEHALHTGRHVEIPLVDLDALTGSYKAHGGLLFGKRDPDYEREMRKLYENAEINP
jgi:hypothetical protein